MLHLLKGSREELAKYIKEQNKKIVVYGAGMIGKVIIPDYLLQYDIMMFKRRAVLDFSALPAFFVTNLLLVQCENHYFRRLIVSFNC